MQHAAACGSLHAAFLQDPQTSSSRHCSRHCNASACSPVAMRGYRGVKYILFVFCYVFWVVSAIVITVGIYAKVAKEKDVVDTLIVDPALLLVMVGSLTFFITFLGCLGALRNAACLLKTFAAILAVVLLVQLTAGILGYLFTDTVMERTERFMMKTIVRYREDHDLENAIDFVQKKCCGVDGYKDWSKNVYFECSDSNPSMEACGVPFSCCVVPSNQTMLNTMCGLGTQQQDRERASDDIFTDGCLDKIVLWIRTNMKMLAGMTGGLLLLEACMISLAVAQVCWINKVHQRQAELATRRASQRKDELWFPAFADFDTE